MASLLRAYNAMLQRRPMATQCVTGAVLFGAGDVLAQQAIEKNGRKHDFTRTARLAFFGGAIFAPAISKWFQVLNRVQFISPAKTVASRVSLDQSIGAPAVVFGFFTSMALLEGKDLREVKRRLTSAYVPTLIRNWGVFIPTQVINFALVPTHLRFVVVGVVSLFWNTYLSYANSQAQSALLAKSVELPTSASSLDDKAADLEKAEPVTSVAPT